MASLLSYNKGELTVWVNGISQMLVHEHSEIFLPNSSIGYDISAPAWRHDLSRAKFCLVIRGDTPGSRSLFRAIRSGCMPLVVSDALEAYAPLFRSWLRYDDFAVRVPEADFAHNPAQALEQASSRLSTRQMQQKLDGLALVQRILVLDDDHHLTSPSSLFVPALVKEIMASQKPGYFPSSLPKD